MLLTSTQNPRIKAVDQLTTRASERKRTGMFVVEGTREIRRALDHHFEMVEIFHCPDILDEKSWSALGFDKITGAQYYTVSRNVYARIAYRDNSGGAVAIMRQKTVQFDDLEDKAGALYLVLESVEKPGNLGAILRTADAAGLEAIFICDARTDVYNPNVVRSSTGALFSVPVVTAGSRDVIEFLKKRKVQILSTYLGASVPYHSAELRKSTAIVLGTEAEGLSDTWIQASDQHIIIPMKGTADSLNVATTAAIVVFEAVRQRSSHT